MVNQIHVPGPLPDLISPLLVGIVVGGASQTSGKLEEAAVADGVLVVEAVGVAFENLPEDAAATMGSIPAGFEPLEDVLAYIEPRRKLLSGLGEVVFGGGHDSVAPEEEVIVSFFISVFGRQIVVFGAEIDLGKQGIENDVVVAGVLGDMVVVDHHAPEGTGHPPVVWAVDVAESPGIGR